MGETDVNHMITQTRVILFSEVEIPGAGKTSNGAVGREVMISMT